MRFVSHMRALRGDRAIREVEEETGVSRGYLSLYERGRAFPPDEQREVLEQVYGPVAGWYDPEVLFLLQRDTDQVEVAG